MDWAKTLIANFRRMTQSTTSCYWSTLLFLRDGKGSIIPAALKRFAKYRRSLSATVLSAIIGTSESIQVTIMLERDLFVAFVAIVLGGVIVWAGAVSHSLCFQIWLPKLLDRKFGRDRARFIVVMMGAVAIGIGGYLIYRAQRPQPTNSQTRPPDVETHQRPG